MNDRYQLVAYLATLGALVAVLAIAFVAAIIEPTLIGRLEAFGLGTVTGGLIGVLRMPQRNAVPSSGDAPIPVKVANQPDDAVPVDAVKPDAQPAA